MQDNEAACIPHAASFRVFFRRQGSVHLARRLFFDCSSPPPARSTTRRRASHMPPRFLFFHQRRSFPPRAMRRTTRRRASHTPPCFLSINDGGAACNPHAAPSYFLLFPPCWGELPSHSVVGEAACVTHTPPPFHFVYHPRCWGGDFISLYINSYIVIYTILIY